MWNVFKKLKRTSINLTTNDKRKQARMSCNTRGVAHSIYKHNLTVIYCAKIIILKVDNNEEINQNCTNNWIWRSTHHHNNAHYNNQSYLFIWDHQIKQKHKSMFSASYLNAQANCMQFMRIINSLTNNAHYLCQHNKLLRNSIY